MSEPLDRRKLLGAAALVGAVELLRPGRALAAKAKAEAAEVNATEDLMREHGVLRRVLLVYEESVRRLEAKQPLKPELLAGAANIIRTFIEGYHEKLEEEQVFPRMEKAGQQLELVKTLRAQHAGGRKLTAEILAGATPHGLGSAQGRTAVVRPVEAFIRMYRPHAAREDTVLFPAFHALFTEKEFDALGEKFEEQEHALLGGGSFEGTLKAVEQLEQALGIYDLAQFTPR